MDHSEAPERTPIEKPSPLYRDTEALRDRLRRGEYSVDPGLVAQAFIEWHRRVRAADLPESSSIP